MIQVISVINYSFHMSLPNEVLDFLRSLRDHNINTSTLSDEDRVMIAKNSGNLTRKESRMTSERWITGLSWQNLIGAIRFTHISCMQQRLQDTHIKNSVLVF